MQNSPTLPRSTAVFTGLVVAAVLLANVFAALSAPASARAAAGTAAVAFGDNNFAELGAGYKSGQEEIPVTVLGLSNVASVALGYHFDVALLGDGTVRTWGGNAFGQLGDKTRKTSMVPMDIGLHGVKTIASGGGHTLALLEDGTVVGWGDDEYGELGNGVLNPLKRLNRFGTVETTMQGSASAEPVAVPKLTGVVGIAAGNGSEFALLANGTVLAWGKNDKGQLGTGHVGPQICKTEIGEIPCSTKPEPVVLTSHELLRNVKALAGGSEANYALLTSGHVMAWGSDGRGQLGNNSILDSDVAVEVHGLANATSVSGGAPYALALLSTGQVVGWGGNDMHQLGVQPAETCRTEPCVKTPRLVAGLEHVSAVSAGRAFTLALINGKLWALGDNEPWGQLGIGSLISTSTPKPIEGLAPVASITAGEQHAVAILQSGSGPMPRFSAAPSGGSLNVTWTVDTPVSALRWRIFKTWTEGGSAWSTMTWFKTKCSVSVPCTYTLAGLPAVPIEVELLSYISSKDVATRRTVATP
jgi:alpha-tubulin suppressor-like RCC1 family protein